MRVPDFALVAGCISISFAAATPLTAEHTSRAVGLPIQRKRVDPHAALIQDRARLRRRQADTVDIDLDNELSLYFANLTLGTPPQEIRLHLDTGSSDLWVNVAESQICQRQQCQGGVYDGASSSTHRVVNDVFNITYVDGSSAYGDYVSDSLSIGDIALNDFQFGTGQVSTSSQGVLGIGFESNEVQLLRTGSSYPNLPAAMKQAGHIASNVYSLWLNDFESSTGEILFGGVDSAKYTGTLETVPLIEQNGGYRQFAIALSTLSLNGTTRADSLPVGVLLDSGSTLSYLPRDLARRVFTEFNAVWNSNTGAAYVSCNLANEDQSIGFNFSGKSIQVPYDELVLDFTPGDGGQDLRLENGDPACILGISQVEDHIAILGDTFLRSAYVVYDLENNQIALAQTVFNATNSNVEEIATAGGDIPGATPAPFPIKDADVGADGARLGGPSASDAFSVSSKRSDFAAFAAILVAACMVW
ncbi:uncharacterized protein HMPREF1541_05206 [Cyphellophora europaea CBS 101466]|uniref:Probable aspartic-type endopeptidase OPSB n=1 Tax=Cyphellophora europaea (strain CBS 101466) TaxID=1220924 RepID=W2RWR9_CYPE1|nr:uncharacterized protein HMPREF1541_05206 [Cyphellophora europaea CBS 101466]ETN40926.1 hypothetical protein HMPREF1541_05206 [Cyphellophora europaea CBS 101466]